MMILTILNMIFSCLDTCRSLPAFLMLYYINRPICQQKDSWICILLWTVSICTGNFCKKSFSSAYIPIWSTIGFKTRFLEQLLLSKWSPPKKKSSLKVMSEKIYYLSISNVSYFRTRCIRLYNFEYRGSIGIGVGSGKGERDGGLV